MDARPDLISRQLTAAEQRALAAFLAGRMPAGQLHAELLRARTAVPATPVARPVVAPVPALSAA